ncbi:hypothetical protein U8P73_36160 (plasmid) [Rhizobium beringeri]|nr:hypothetical protein U8P73_36160 [Rhizobium beringeri]
MYFYSDTSPKGPSDINVWKMNGSKCYLTHFSNYLFLMFVSKRGHSRRKASVEKEILICEKKLAFWQRHPQFDAEYVQKEKEKDDQSLASGSWRRRGSQPRARSRRHKKSASLPTCSRSVSF